MTARPARFDPVGFVVAGCLILTAGVIYWDAANIPSSTPYGLGPDAVPTAISVGLAVLAFGNVVESITGAFPTREHADLVAIALITGGFAALIAIIGFGGGFIPAMAVLFATTATAFRRRAVGVDLAIGLGMAAIVYLLFTKLLTLSLPTGPIERLL